MIAVAEICCQISSILGRARHKLKQNIRIEILTSSKNQ